MLVRQVWKREIPPPKSSPTCHNDSPPPPPRNTPHYISPPMNNPQRDQIINQLHTISTLINSQIPTPPSSPLSLVQPPTHAQIGCHASFYHCCRTIKLHYGGVFTKSPNRKYINGNITFVDMIDSDEFSVHEIDSMLEDLGQDGHRVMFYHFLKPGCDLDNGLEHIACDRDVVVLGNYVTQGLKLVEVFVEHEKTNPDIYTPPKAKRLVIEELDVEPIISKAGITPVARKLVLDVNNNQTCGKEKGKSSGKDLEGQSSAVGNVEIECDDDRHGEEHTGGDHEIHDEEEREVNDDTDKNMEGNGGHVVETEGEENEQAVETESEEDTEANDETDSEDSDYLVDEENNVDDVDVDMKDFDFHVDEGVEFMGCRDIEQTVDIEEGDGEEIEVLDNDYFESASDSDDEGSRLRKRKLKEIRKQAHANKTYFYVGKDFPNKEDVMACIKEHSIETRREIRFEKNDSERVRAVCRGVIPCLPCVDEITSGANQVIRPSEGIGSKVKWTKKKIAVTRSPQKLTINGGKPNSKKQLDGNQCPWVLLVSKIKNSETFSFSFPLLPAPLFPIFCSIIAYVVLLATPMTAFKMKVGLLAIFLGT
ncbi:mutator type transposase [Tanacetum coccineum]